MAFRRKTRRGSGGNRSTTTFHSNGTGATRSVSHSSTGKQKTGSGGARYTTTILPNGKIRKTITRHGVNGWISRVTKTLGGTKKPKKIKARASTPRTKSSSSSWRPSSSSRRTFYRALPRARSVSARQAKTNLQVLFGIAIIYFIFAYWQYILAAIGIGILGTVIYFLSRK